MIKKKKLFFIFYFQFIFCLNAESQISFLPYQIYSTGSSPEVVTIGDLNNDGLNDIVLGTGTYFDTINDYKLFIYYQDTAGNLLSPIKYDYTHVFPGLYCISLGDFNNDLLTDIVIGYGDSVGIFFQNIAGTLNPMISYYGGNDVYGVKSGDFNNDGLTDFVISLWNSSFIKVFYQDSIGFTNQTVFKPPSGFDEIDAGDVNGDGRDDVVFKPGQISQGIRVYTQNAGGFLNSAVTYNQPATILNSLHGIAIADVNNDGRNDIIATGGGNTPDGRIVIWYQDSITNLLENPVEIFAYDIPEPVEVSDLNCDEKNEIIVVHAGWQAVSVYEQDSSGNFGPFQMFNVTYATHYKPQGLSVGDINNDSKNDVAIADYNYGLILLVNSTVWKFRCN